MYIIINYCTTYLHLIQPWGNYKNFLNSYFAGFRCPATGMYKCRTENRMVCLPQEERCDGHSDCPAGDDEWYCDVTCPSPCQCKALSVECSDQALKSVPPVHSRSRSLTLSGNKLQLLPGSFKELQELGNLDLSRCAIETLPSGVFSSQQNLFTLDLSQNKLKTVQATSFRGLASLKRLYISDNNIYLGPGKSEVFSELSLGFLASDDYTFCCYAELVAGKQECLPEKDNFSSCEDLLGSIVQRVALWVLGWVALLGNILVFVWWSLKGEAKVSSYLVKYLSVADFLMGVYMVSIASVDTHYRGRYIDYAIWWKNSAFCSTLGVLATVSSEASVLTLVAITADRLIAIVWPFSPIRLTVKRARYVLSLIWLLAIMIGLAPFVPGSYFEGEFYSRSGMCISLHITDEVTPGWEYSVAVFHILNLSSFLFIFAAYMLVHRRIKQGMMNKKMEQSAFKRMAVIVFTDFCCWVPLNIMGKTNVPL